MSPCSEWWFVRKIRTKKVHIEVVGHRTLRPEVSDEAGARRRNALLTNVSAELVRIPRTKGRSMATRLFIEDVRLLCDVLIRMERIGRGASSRVAKERGLSKQVASDRIKRVEKHFGCTFVRVDRARTGYLTADGHIFLKRSLEMLEAYDRLRAELANVEGSRTSSLDGHDAGPIRTTRS
jgi:molybdenum-dependent DNA-binding transcriptional regulator ModE